MRHIPPYLRSAEGSSIEYLPQTLTLPSFFPLILVVFGLERWCSELDQGVGFIANFSHLPFLITDGDHFYCKLARSSKKRACAEVSSSRL